jgi:hypothetical protein
MRHRTVYKKSFSFSSVKISTHAPNDEDDEDDDDDAGNATVRRASRVERRRHNARTNVNGAAIETQRRVATVGTRRDATRDGDS